MKTYPTFKTLLLILLLVNMIIFAAPVTVNPVPVDYAFKNPLKGFRPSITWGDPWGHPYGALSKHYIPWNDLENNVNDGVEKILDYCNNEWAGVEDANIKLLPRVYLYYPGRDKAWPADMTEDDFSSTQFYTRFSNFVRKLGQAWDNDSRVAYIEMGIFGQWGEHNEPGRPDAQMQQTATFLFTNYFKNKFTMVRYEFDDQFQDLNFGMYWDSWAHWNQKDTHEVRLRSYNDAGLWLRNVIGGEVAYDWGDGDIQPGSSPDDSLQDPIHRDYIVDLIYELHCNHLGWIDQYDRGNSAVQAGAEIMQKAFGYRFLIDSFIYSGRVEPGGVLDVELNVRNTGSSPFYYNWPIEISLLDTSTHQVVWSDRFNSIDVRDWLPGDDYDKAADIYLSAPQVFQEQESFSIPVSVPTGEYIIALALLDPAGGRPAARFAVENYYNGGRHPMGRIGIGLDPAATAVSGFDDLRNDNSLGYDVIVLTNPPSMSVSLSQPVQGQSFAGPADISMQAVVDNGGTTVTNVVFMIDGSPVGQDSSLPYGIILNGVQPGTWTLSAMAYNDRGDTVQSEGVVVNVKPPDVDELTLTLTGTGELRLDWQNPVNPAFTEVQIQRSSTVWPLLPGDGTTVYTGSAEEFSDSGLAVGTEYFYTVFARTSGGLYSMGAQVSGIPINIPNVIVSAPPAGAYLGGVTVLTGYVVDGVNATTAVYLSNGISGQWDSLSFSHPAWWVDWDSTTAPDGPHTLYFKLSNVPNIHNGTVSLDINIDNSPPAAAVTNLETDENVSGVFSFRGSAADPHSPLTGLSFFISNSTGIIRNTSPAVSIGSWESSWDSTGQENGFYYAWVEAVNSTGLVTVSPAIRFILENRPPLTNFLLIDDFDSISQFDNNLNDLGEFTGRVGGLGTYAVETPGELRMNYWGPPWGAVLESHINLDISTFDHLVINMASSGAGNEVEWDIGLNDGNDHYLPLENYAAGLNTSMMTVTIPLTDFGADLSAVSMLGLSNDGGWEELFIDDISLVRTNIITVFPPAAPTGLNIIQATNYSVSLGWIDNSDNEIGFKIYWSTSSTRPPTDNAVTTADTESFTAEGLTPGTLYYFWVTAINSDGESADTSASASTSAVPSPPVAPDGLGVVSISQESMQLNWNDNSTDEISYHLYLDTVNLRPAVPTAVYPVDTVSAVLNMLQSGTVYYIWLNASNQAGVSSFVSIVTNTPVYPVPAAVTNFSIDSAGVSNLELSWQPADGLAEGFILYRHTQDDLSNAVPAAAVASNQLSIGMTGLTPGTTYYFWILATNVHGQSAYSQVSGSTGVVPVPAPGTPVNLTVSNAINTRLELYWQPADSFAEGFVIYQAMDNVFSNAALIAAMSSNSWTLTVSNLSHLELYYFWIIATNSSGISAPAVTNLSTLHVEPPPPLPPGNLRIIRNASNEIEIAWDDMSTNEVGFYIYYNISSNRPAVYQAQAGTGVTNCTLSNLTPGQDYYIWVSAYGWWESAAAGPVSVTTLPVTNIIIPPADIRGNVFRIFPSVIGADDRTAMIEGIPADVQAVKIYNLNGEFMISLSPESYLAEDGEEYGWAVLDLQEGLLYKGSYCLMAGAKLLIFVLK